MAAVTAPAVDGGREGKQCCGDSRVMSLVGAPAWPPLFLPILSLALQLSHCLALRTLIREVIIMSLFKLHTLNSSGNVF